MSLPVDIDSLAEDLNALPDEASAYVHRESGELLIAPDADVGAYEDEDEPSAFEWDWSDEDLEKLREIARSSRWVRLPGKYDIHEWSIMERFARSAGEPLGSRLQSAIRGRGAFRSFRDEIERAGLVESWFAFKHSHIVGLVAEVLEDEKVPYVARGS